MFEGERKFLGMGDRIQQKAVDISYQNVQKFFEERGENGNLAHKYNYVLFQDDNPELAVQRDEQEKQKICGLLELKPGQRVLDLGCGVGRWGEELCGRGLYYVGIDGSPALIERAQKNLQQFPNRKLLVGLFQEFLNILKENGEGEAFSLIFVNGVFMYLNDEDFGKALDDIKCVCGSECQIYIKESMGVEERLTLDQIYSEGLRQEYSAIYRSISEYREATTKVFGSGDFQLISEGELFDASLHNRKETTDYYMIWKNFAYNQL